MTKQTPNGHKRIKARFTHMRRLAYATLLLERVTEVLWKPVLWIALFTALWAGEFIGGDWPQTIAALIFWGGIFVFVRTAILNFEPIKPYDIDRRLESDSGLQHRPLQIPQESLANPEKDITRELWSFRNTTFSSAVKALKLNAAKPVLTSRDPYALRAFIILLLILGIGMGGLSSRGRVERGLFPFELPGFSPSSLKTASITITPPAYTGLGETILYGHGGQEVVDIPEGSTIKAIASRWPGTPVLTMGDSKYDMTPQGEDVYVLEKPLEPAQTIGIRQLFFPRVSWKINVIPDDPPAITLKGDPVIMPRGDVRLPLVLYDDYGVRNLSLSLTLDPTIANPPLGKPYQERRAVYTAKGESKTLSPVFNLSWHSWAGTPVILQVTAIDDRGQIGTSKRIPIVLPERLFQHPVSKELIAQRKRLALDHVKSTPDVVQSIARIDVKPESYGNDAIIHLALRATAFRLALKQDADTALSVLPLLWDVAVQLEDGNMDRAERNLQNAREDLENALGNPNTSDEELALLMEKFQNAMAEYFREMSRELQKNAAANPSQSMMPMDMLSKLLTPEDLSSFLNRLQSQMMNGDRKSAREMLSQFSQMMDSLSPSMNAPMPEDMKSMVEGINDLQKLIEKQKELLEQTKDQAQETEKDTIANKTEQEALRKILGELMTKAGEKLKEVPENLSLAEQAMRDSSDALGRNEPEEAVPSQETALEELQKSQQQLAQQLMGRMEQMMGLSIGMGQTDPLGRRLSNGENSLLGDSKIKIPDETQRKKIEEILETLRERSGDYSRPDYELDYYKRLMKQF